MIFFNYRRDVFLFCILWVSCALQAQECRVQLQGKVVEEDGNPLPFASIYALGTECKAIADGNGLFTLSGLCAHTRYTIRIQHVQSSSVEKAIDTGDSTEIRVFRLAAHALIREVVVAQKTSVTVAIQPVSKVSSADLEQAKSVHLGEALKNLPGVHVLTTGATLAKPVIQGLHSNRVAIVQNNVVLEGQQWGSEHAPEVDLFAFDRVSVVKGAAGVRYGSGAFAGAVVLEAPELRQKDGWGGWLSAGGASNGRSGFAAGSTDWHLPGRSLALRLQGTAKRSGNLRAPDYWLGNTGSALVSMSALAGWKTKKGEQTFGHEISLSSFRQKIAILRAAHIGNLTELQAAINSDIPLKNRDSFYYALERPRQEIQHHTGRYRLSMRFSDRWRGALQYGFQYNRRHEYDVVRRSNDALPQLSFRLWTNTLDASIEHLPGGPWKGSAGIQGTWQLNDVGRGGLIPDYTQWRGALWATERWKSVARRWEIEMGVRYDYARADASTSGSLRNVDTLVHFGGLSGTTGVLYHITDGVTLLLNSGYAWRPPHVNELFARGVHHAVGTYEEGQPSLNPERAWNTQINATWQKERLSTAVTVYRNQIQDFIYLKPLSSFVLTSRGAFPSYRYEQAAALLQGLDAMVRFRIASAWTAEGQFSAIRGRRRASSAVCQYEDLPLMPADRVRYALKWAPRRIGKKTLEEGTAYIRFTSTTVARQTRLPVEGLLKPPPAAFHLAGIDAAYVFSFRGRRMEVGFDVQNLTNRKYREYLNFFRFFTDEPGINAGIRGKFIF